MGTLANCSAILRLFSPNRLEISVTEVSNLLGMPKSSASRLLKAMREEGLLRNLGQTPRYGIGDFLFTLARLHRNNSSLVQLADRAIADLSRKTGHTGYVSILDGAEVMVIRVHRGTQPLQVVTPLGQRATAYATSTGRVLLARLDNDAIRALHPNRLAPPSDNAPRTVGDLLKRVEKARRTGYCEAIDEAIPGVHSIAVCVSDAEHRETLSFCLSFSSVAVSAQERRQILTLLTDSARAIAHEVDDRFWAGNPRAQAA